MPWGAQEAKLIGYMWFCFRAYEEGEVPCRFMVTPASPAVFDFDFYAILPRADERTVARHPSADGRGLRAWLEWLFRGILQGLRKESIVGSRHAAWAGGFRAEVSSRGHLFYYS
jgi:hypothetical protein